MGNQYETEKGEVLFTMETRNRKKVAVPAAVTAPANRAASRNAAAEGLAPASKPLSCVD